MFTQSQYLQSVFENLPPNSIVVTVTAHDLRQGAASVLYTISSGNENSLFGIDPALGVVSLLGSLDFENRQAHLLTVSAFGFSSQSATASVLIFVTDVNDNAPVFTQPVFTGSIAENTPPGYSLLQLSATDADVSPSNNQISFLLLPPVPEFRLNMTTGVLTSQVVFDFESMQSYSFTVVATDSGDPSLSSTATVNIAIVDENDVRPQFTRTLTSAQISELAALGSPVAQVMAIDPDTDNITYSLIEGNEDGSFEINPSSGLITLSGTLDFESTNFYSLTVAASDGVDTLQLSSTAVVTVEVADGNDNPPIFSQDIYVTTLAEDISPGRSVLAVFANDSDSGINGRVMYSFRNDTQDSRPFRIDQADGVITLSSPIDYEVQSLYEFTVYATDGGEVAQSSQALVRVILTDINDNPPIFANNNISVTLNEDTQNGSQVALFLARDGDSGSNAAVTYQLQESGAVPFSINPNTGVVQVDGFLDYESETSYQLMVVASDSGVTRLSSTALLTIAVTDVNDNPPVFAQQQYSTSVSESLPITSVVINVEASDSDSGSNAVVRYAIVAGNSNQAFEIDNTTGAIALANSLDFEMVSSYRLSVRAANILAPNILASTVVVIVDVTEVNEFTPTFTMNQYMFAVEENQPVGMAIGRVEATDVDGGPSGQVSYEITSGDAGPPFAILINGTIITSMILDREEQDMYLFTVVAKDSGIPPLNSSVQVTVTILDTNDSPPRFFFSSYSASVDENVVAGTDIVLSPPLMVSDADDPSSANALVTFSIISGNEDGLFAIEAQTGLLQTAGMLDYESASNYVLQIQAADSGSPALSSTASVSVIIIDENDNAPFISGAPSQLTFLEGQNRLLVTPNVTVGDADSLPLSLVTITLSTSNPDLSRAGSLSINSPPSPNLLSISNNGQTLQLTGSYDDEEATFVLRTLEYVNTEDEPESSNRTITIVLADGQFQTTSQTVVVVQLVNDNRPILDLDSNSPGLDYSITFIEGGQPVPLAGDVAVSDLDMSRIVSVEARLTDAQDGHLEGLLVGSVSSQYTIEYRDQNHTVFISFSLPSTLSTVQEFISTMLYFNMADEPSFPLSRSVLVTISDGELDSIPATANISIQLVNDPPVITLGSMTDIFVTFMEGEGPVLLSSQLSIFDSDSEVLLNASVSLLEAPDNSSEMLLINASAGLPLVVTSRDHSIDIQGPATPERFVNLLRTVQYDNILQHPSSAIRMVKYTVSDSLILSEATVFVSFNLFNDPPILDLNGPFPGRDFVTLFTEGSLPIRVTSSNLVLNDVDNVLLSSATISLASRPDKELEGLALLSIPSELTVDVGPARIEVRGQASTSVYASLLTEINYFNMAEEPTAGDRVIMMVVSDGDSNSSIVTSTVQVQQVNDPPVLIINNGTVFTTAYVEEQPPVVLVDTRYDIMVEDSDNGTFSHLSLMLNNIVDGDSEILGYEDMSADQSLFVVSSQGLEPNSRIVRFQFSTSSSTSANYITLLSTLTYRSTSREPTAGQREVTFTISDGFANSQTQRTNVDIVLVNDNIPIFQQFLYTARVRENLANVPVTTIVASDEDSYEGQYAGQGRVIYEIIGGNEAGLFQINQNTGEISITTALDREEGTFNPALTVRASNVDNLDPDVEGNFPTVFVIITVEDVNDNTPQFQGIPYLFQVTEHAMAGTSVGNVTATDADVGRNSQIEYAITQGIQNNALLIDANSGEIRVGNSELLDREVMSSILFSVTAQDGGTPQTSNTTLVTLNLIDINDNPPVFSQNAYMQPISELTPVNTNVLTVSAQDADEGLNKQLSFSLSGSSAFTINSSSGEIYTAIPLDRETQSVYSFQVQAVDSGTPALSSTATVEITLEDENDNPPIFEERQYNIMILEQSPLQQPVDVLLAVDADSGSNAEISYTIIESSIPFSIDAQSGIITVNGTLDREVQNFYSFTVLARDNGNPQQSAQITYNITILDVNDNMPLFDQQSYFVSTTENRPLLFALTTVTASDRDIGSNAELVFSLMDPSQTFQIDSSTGEIFTAGDLDFETQSMYVLDITVSDRGQPPLSMTTTLTVNLTDENDNAPVFSQELYQFTVMENLAPHAIGPLSARDSDSGTNAGILYTLIDPSGSGVPFTIDQDTGELSVTAPLDREMESNYSFSILATDMGSPSLSSLAFVLVLVEDANDNSPMFSEVYALTVIENMPVNSTLLTVRAQDVDAGSNAEIMYQIISGNSLGLFSIDRFSGVLILVSELDAESSIEHRLQVQASDNGAPSQSSITTVIISVGNINDEPISIDIPSPSVSYTEESPPVSIFSGVTVTDRDVVTSVENSTVELMGTQPCCEELIVTGVDIPGVSVQLKNKNTSLVIQGPATIAQISQILQSILYVDFNPEPEIHTITVRVTVSDGVFVDESDIVVTVNTINDNAPVVNLDNSNPNYTSTFLEDSIGISAVDQVVITDQDSGLTMLQSLTVSLLTAPDGILEALSISPAGLVTVFPFSGHILRLSGPAPIEDFVSSLSSLRYVNMADNPQEPLLRVVEVIADDGMFQSIPSFALIEIVPLNDPPRLWLSSEGGFNTTFVENGNPVRLTNEGSQLLDPDSFILASSIVTIMNPINEGYEYILVSSSSPPTIVRSSESEVVLLGPAPITSFLQAIQSVFYFNNASEPSVGYREISFNVSDGELAFSVSAFVLIETVNDPPVVDLNGLVQSGDGFSTTFTEGGLPVSVAASNAVIEDADNTTIESLVISIQQLLDGSHEVLSISNVPEYISQVYSSGTLVLSGEANLTLYSTLLREIVYVNTAEEPSGIGRLIQVTCSDGLAESESSFAMIDFSFINDAPVVALSSTVNFATTYQENSPAIPISNLRSARITDVDSTTLSYLTVVAANLLDGQLEIVNFTDPLGDLLVDIMEDQGTDRVYNLSYGMPMPLSTFNEIFLSIEYLNTAIEPNAAMPRRFFVTVNDGELTSLPAISTVSIQLVDDNEPQFSLLLYFFNVSEDSVGSIVGSVSATDLDVGDMFLYQFSNVDTPFTINRTTGVISTTAALDREVNRRYEITVLTTRPAPPFSVFDGQATVIINVLDINDNPPSFNQTSITLQIAEDVEIGRIIANITATDPDDGTNAAIVYIVEEVVPFVVDQLTGSLATAQSLDREQTDVYHFTVTAADSGSPSLSSSVSVNIHILDINDNTPQFLQSSYYARLMENTPVSTSVTQLSAQDRDTGSNGRVTFSLSPVNPQFSLDAASGIITTVTTLTPGIYNFTAIAEDAGSPSLAFSVPVTIEIISFNSTLPVFTQSSYDASVLENTPQGSSIVQVTATDPTGGNNLTYAILSMEFSDSFNIDSVTGVIVTGTSVLDREQQDFYQLQVSASSADQVRTAVTQVNIRVLDENDFAPMFIQSMYFFTIAENNEVGASIGSVSAVDLQDIGINAQILNYTTSSQEFFINLAGIVSANRIFDRESQMNYSFVVFASDSGAPSLTGSALVHVEILDVNDQVPVFTQSSYEGKVPENAPVGTSVLVVTATDNDLRNNGEVTYSTNSTLFSVDSLTGLLTTAVEFDFESDPNATYEATVAARDSGSPVSLSSSVKILVSIIDVDDTPPVFSMQTYFASILEGGLQMSFLQVVATDSDSDLETNPISYLISGGNTNGVFIIDSLGSLSVVQPIDRELVSQYDLTIQASNQNSQGMTLTSSASVVVEILDINDNSPVFLGQPYAFSVLEGSPPGTMIGTLSATDMDLAMNANISGFRIVSGDSDNQFQIGSLSGILQLSTNGISPDRERQSQYTLTVAVSDNGSPPQSAMTNVSISILDANDNAPVFNQPEYSISVSESISNGTTIFSAASEVTDADIGSNAALLFSLVGPVFDFAMSSDGQVTVTNTLDFENQRSYTLMLQAVDGGDPSQTGTAQLFINVLDQDDLPLQFSSSVFNTSILENLTVGSSILTVVATDPDTVQGNPITYSIQETSLPFFINSQSGAISVAAQLDREIQSTYSFPVLASNTPGFTATAMVIIEVLDINDNVPQFNDGPFLFSVSESEPVGFIIGQVSASDEDVGSSGAISSYALVGNPPIVTINPFNGTLILVGTLDFEATESYIFGVLATDDGIPGLTGQSSVTLNVLDSNDNPPQFSADQYIETVFENTTIGATIFIAVAQDADSGSNGDVFYFLGQPNSEFVINSTTGAVISSLILSVQNYSISIVAQDRGSPSLSSAVTLTVVVLDVNERPVFSEEIYTAIIPEDRAVNSLVVEVFASDPDSGTNADITFSIATQDQFSIDSQTGRVMVRRPLDFEAQMAYVVAVFAVDAGNPPLSAETTLVVNVTDSNDNPPMFLENPYQATVPENISVGTSILTVQAVDADSTSNAAVTYNILQDFSTGSVSIDPLSGTIRTIGSLDYEAMRVIEVVVEARDGGTPFRTSTVMVIINISDVDDNPPVFSLTTFMTSVGEELDIGGSVIRVLATDADNGTNAEILYSLSNSEDFPFTINPQSGVIFLANPGFDREFLDHYMFDVEAYNPSSSLFRSSASVVVNVLDFNDNRPLFDLNTLTVSVSEASPLGTSIGRVVATDADTGNNAVISYSIDPPSSLVSVDSSSGELQLESMLDFETMQILDLTVEATDSGTPPLTNAANLRIIVRNINDEPPVLDSTATQFIYQEGSPPVVIGGGITVLDSDMLPLVSGTAELFYGAINVPPPPTDFIQTNLLQGALGQLQVTANARFINISGSASASTYASLLTSLQFGSTADEPDPLPRLVTLQVNDGMFISNFITLTVNVALINDNDPVLDLSTSTAGLGYSVTFTEGGLPVFLVGPDLRLRDSDGDLFQSINVTLTNSMDAEERLNSFDSLGIIQILNRRTSIELTGPATAVEFELALQFITYNNLASEPGNPQQPRLIEFVASDGLRFSQPAVTTVTIQTVNDRPVISLGSNSLDTVLIFVETDAFLSLVSSDVLITDVDTSLLAFVNVTITNYVQGVEQLRFSTVGYNITSEVLSGTLLLTGPALSGSFEAVLQTIEYINTNIEEISMQGQKSVQFTVNDGSLNSLVASAFITFSAINDPPIIDLNGPLPGLDFAATFVEDEGRVAVVSRNLTIIDVDSPVLQSATVFLQGILDPLSEILSTNLSIPEITTVYNASNGMLRLQGPSLVSNFVFVLRSLTYDDSSMEPTPGIRRITFSAFDGNDSSIPVAATITVLGRNDAPEVFVTPLNSLFIEERGPIQLIDTNSAGIVDTDSPMLSTLEVELRNALDGDLENIFVPTTIQNVAVSRQTHDNTSFFVFSFPSPFATLANFVSVLANLSYNNSAVEPSGVVRYVDIAVFDENLRSNVITIAINVQLVNDNVPQFDAQEVDVPVPEDAANQTAVYRASALDVDDNSGITYSLTPTAVPFLINSMTGLVSVFGSLDRDNQIGYTLNISAFDGLNTGLLVLRVTVTDVNDNSPVFELNPFTASVSENAPLGTSVIRIIADDADEGLNGRLSFSIREGNPQRLFSINSTTGEIFTSNSIDFEMLPLHTLSVMAEDSGSPRRSNTTFVIITIIDTNDNPPVFNPGQATLTLPEDTPLSTLLYSVQATDADANTQLMYTLVNGSRGLFSVDFLTGQLFLVENLDFESDFMHLIGVEASDGQQSSTFQLHLFVSDVDDNPPVFTQGEYTASIPENATIGTNVLQGMLLRVTDLDSGPNAEVQFVIQSGDPHNQFALNQLSSDSAQLILARTLNREAIATYAITVVAVNPVDPNQNDSALIVLTVLDVNDSPPIFNSSSYRFTVAENSTLGTTIGRISASDADEGANAVVSYRLASGNGIGIFTITAEGFILLSDHLDFELTTVYSIAVEASDGGTPSLSGIATVVISVQDINDNSPVFSQNVTVISINENMPMSTIIVILQANDSDSGSNGDIRYSVHARNSNDFSIDPREGRLITSREFDFESDPSELVVTIIAMDNGNPALSSESFVVVNLQDVNEFAPQFTLNITQISVREDAQPSVVLDLHAVDGDGGSAGVVGYRLSGDTASLPFFINNETGEIFLNSSLDHEQIQRYEVYVEAFNPFVSPEMPTRLNLVFVIEDVNDNPPVFTQVDLSVSITATTNVGDTVFVISAVDADTGRNGEILYSLLNFNEQFNITTVAGAGRITLAAPLDTMTTRNFNLTIVATDQGEPSLSSSTVLIVDIIQPLLVDFSQQGAGFLLNSESPTVQDFGFFANSPAGSDGLISATLGEVSVSASYNTSLPQAVTVRGVVLSEEVWHDMPEVTVVFQVADSIGDVHCSPTEVVVTLVPDASLRALANINRQVRCN